MTDTLGTIASLLELAARVLRLLPRDEMRAAFDRAWVSAAGGFQHLVSQHDVDALAGRFENDDLLTQAVTRMPVFPTVSELHDTLLDLWKRQRDTLRVEERNAFFSAHEIDVRPMISLLAEAYRRELSSLASFSDAHVTAALGPEKASSRDAAWSEARLNALVLTARLWLALGVPGSTVYRLAASRHIGAQGLPAKSIVAVTGPSGSGKTLCLLRAYAAAIDAAQNDNAVPIPVWLPTGDTDLSAAASRARALGSLERGIAFFADTTTKSLANALMAHFELERARYSRASLVVTSRETLPDVDDFRLAPLSREDAIGLVVNVVGRASVASTIWNWPQALLDAVALPTFAIIAATTLNEANTSTQRSKGELMHFVVEPVLRDHAAARATLRRLSARVVEAGGGAVPQSEAGDPVALRHLVEHGLVALDNGGASFPVTLVADWCAADALDPQYDNPVVLRLERSNLERWRTALTMFVASKPHDVVDRVLAPIVRSDPALAAEVVASAVPSWGLGEDIVAPPDWRALQQWGAAWIAWKEGLGKLGELVSPLSPSGDWLETQLVAGGPYLEIATTFDSSAARRTRIRSFSPGRRSAWVWLATLEDIQSALTDLVRARAFPTSSEVLRNEELWQAAAVVVQRAERNVQPIPIDDVDHALHGAPDTYSIGPTNPRLTVGKLRQELSRLRAQGSRTLAFPWPVTSRAVTEGDFPTAFTDAELLARTLAILRESLRTYEKLAEEWFAPISHRFGFVPLMPYKLVGGLDFGDGPSLCRGWVTKS